MPFIEYVPRRFQAKERELLGRVNQIINEYAAAGYQLTLRQLFYQLVGRVLILNTVKAYKQLGALVVNARRAGLIDWDAIEDRTRNLRGLRHWDDPPDGVRWLANQYAVDKWATQPNRVEVWIEKEALAGVFERACVAEDVPFFCCRGYNSESEMWGAAQRLREYQDLGQNPYILHFGDHDPSGIDMTRDICDRMNVFGVGVEVDRRALNVAQVKKFKLPPNPARVTDSRYKSYMAKFGKSSWELDALEPQVLAELVRQAVVALRDDREWAKAVVREAAEKKQLVSVTKKWDKVKRAIR